LNEVHEVDAFVTVMENTRFRRLSFTMRQSHYAFILLWHWLVDWWCCWCSGWSGALSSISDQYWWSAADQLSSERSSSRTDIPRHYLCKDARRLRSTVHCRPSYATRRTWVNQRLFNFDR